VEQCNFVFGLGTSRTFVFSQKKTGSKKNGKPISAVTSERLIGRHSNSTTTLPGTIRTTICLLYFGLPFYCTLAHFLSMTITESVVRGHGRRNLSPWDGPSRPNFRSGTARMDFCRPTFWTARIAFCRPTFRSKFKKRISL